MCVCVWTCCKKGMGQIRWQAETYKSTLKKMIEKGSSIKDIHLKLKEMRKGTEDVVSFCNNKSHTFDSSPSKGSQVDFSDNREKKYFNYTKVCFSIFLLSFLFYTKPHLAFKNHSK